MKTIKPYRLIVLLAMLFANICTTQISITSAQVATITTAGTATQGDYYLTSDTNNLYVGLEDGSLQPIGIITNTGTTTADVLTWNTTTNTWQPQNPETNGLFIEKETLRYKSSARLKIQPETNINTGTFVITPQNFELNETTATISGNTITGLVGNLRFIVQPQIFSFSIRTNFICNFLVNGAIRNNLSGALYNRAENNHDETGTNFIFEYEGALATDTFSFSFTREANTGNVELISQDGMTSYIYIEHYKTMDAIVDFSVRANLTPKQGLKGDTGDMGPTGPQGLQGSAALTPTYVYHASGVVNANGIPRYIQGCSVVKNPGIGSYTITFDTPHANGANYPILFAMEQNAGRDDYVSAYNNVTANGFDIQISEHDTGTAPGTFVEAGFSFFISF